MTQGTAPGIKEHQDLGPGVCLCRQVQSNGIAEKGQQSTSH